MTDDERSSQLSAMFDGELPPAECELLARRLARDEALRRQWGGYALIGASVRGEPLAAHGAMGARADLAARVRDALAQSPDAPALDADAGPGQDGTGGTTPARRQPKLPRWAMPLSGVGVAASVAAVGVAAAALFWLRTDAPTVAAVANVVPAVRSAPAAEVVVPMPLPPAPPVAGNAAPSAPPVGAADSYTVPPPPQGAAGLAGGATLANFLVAHSEVSMPMLRRNALSTLVAVPVEPEPVADRPAAAPAAAAVEGAASSDGAERP